MKKNKEIHILRGLTITSVVAIHLLNLALINIEVGERGYTFYHLLHSLFQFAVPCFIFISSLVFAYNFRNKPFKWVEYISKKFRGIFLPYVGWTLFYLLIQMSLGYIPFYKLLNPGSWFYWLAYGKAYTHLYFMSVILQFYIAAPFMFWGIKRLCRLVGHYQGICILILAVVPQIAIYWINRLFIYQYFSSTATLFIWYWCLSVIGLWIGLRYDEWMELFSRLKYFFIIFFGLSTVVYGMYRFRLLYQLQVDTFYYQIVWYIYVLLASLILLVFSKWLIHKERTATWFSCVADYSFEIYFIHPLFTFIMCKLITISHPVLLMIVIVIGYKLIIEACFIMAKLIRHYKLLYWSVGKYQPLELDFSNLKL